MAGDWIRLHRRIMDSQVWENDGLLKLWLYCLLKATWKPRWVSTKNGSEVWLEAGQFLFGRASAAKFLKMKPSSVRNRLEKLRSMGNVDIKSNSKGTIVSVCHWETYQSWDEDEGTGERTAEGQREDSGRTAGGQREDTNNKGKKVEEGETSKEGKDSSRRTSYSEADMATAEAIKAMVLDVVPKMKPPNMPQWAKDIRLMRERDSRTDDEIRELFTWANKHSFWRANILCPSKLREKFDQLTAKMEENSNGQANPNHGLGKNFVETRPGRL